MGPGGRIPDVLLLRPGRPEEFAGQSSQAARPGPAARNDFGHGVGREWPIGGRDAGGQRLERDTVRGRLQKYLLAKGLRDPRRRLTPRIGRPQVAQPWPVLAMTCLQTVLRVSNTPMPVSAQASRTGEPVWFRRSLMSSAEKMSGRSRLFSWITKPN